MSEHSITEIFIADQLQIPVSLRRNIIPECNAYQYLNGILKTEISESKWMIDAWKHFVGSLKEFAKSARTNNQNSRKS